MKKSGFTLAEVLITLGIIGVVAAVTLPTLVMDAKYKQVGVKLHKFHTNIENAARSYVAANGEFSEKDSHLRSEALLDFFNTSFDYKETYKTGKPTPDNSMAIKYVSMSGTAMFNDFSTTSSYGVLKDSTEIAYNPNVTTTSYGTINTGRYPADKYGSQVASIYFAPKVKGLADRTRKIYVFVMTSKGIVVPAQQDTCLNYAYGSGWKINSADYKSGGVCYNTPTTPTTPTPTTPEPVS